MKSAASKTILLTWELGDELGHLARLRPLALTLQRCGHHVLVATSHAKNVSVLPESIPVIAAPSPRLAPVRDAIREPATFADILYNTGITRPGALARMVRDWGTIFDQHRPDVVVQDFSPFALLALQGRAPRSVLLGTGFACPPDVRPLPDMRAWQNHYPDRLLMTENAVLDALNSQLEAQDQAPLDGIGELYTRVDANLLATVPGLDHYPSRPRTSGPTPDYLGVWSDLGGDAPRWPAGERPRVFAYLKPFHGLQQLLDHLAASGHSCLVFTSAKLKADQWPTDTLRIVPGPLDMRRVIPECDLAILHAGHGSTAQMLLGGVPVLQLPFNVEQYHTAKNTERLGAGVMALTDNPAAICAAYDRLASDASMRRAAEAFAARHAEFSEEDALARALARIESLARLER